VAGELRPPSPEEVPSRTLLAYGTSITQGANAGRPYLDWPSQAAWRLGWNLINLGMSGSCHAEAAFGDHIAAREDWDVAVLSLSVNMIGAGFTVAEFRSRVEYIIRTVSSRHPNKPVVCISIFPYFGDWDLSLQPNAAAPPDAFRDALADVASAVGTPNVHFIDGRTLLSGPAGLTADLIHPSDLGMIEIGEGVARRIRELLGR
jgi:lysophospholipase L1-like esterase